MFVRPLNSPDFVSSHLKPAAWFVGQKNVIKDRITKLCTLEPKVSVVIPAYNEESHILRTLSSLSFSVTQQTVEIIVVDNNSSDRTIEFVEGTGVTLIREMRPGVKHARNTGLQHAKGKFILNADADSIYSPYWIDLMTLPLRDHQVACTYGSFAFFSERKRRRFSYFLYESLGDLYKVFKGRKNHAMYVYGCSSGYRKIDGLTVKGYEHPEGANEDGYLALKLNQRFGELRRIEGWKSLVWTSDRKLEQEGGLVSAFLNRAKNLLRK